MTIEELDREIELKIAYLKNQKEKDCFLYVSNFIEHNNFDSVSNFQNFDIYGFLISYYYVHNKNKSIADITIFVNNLINILNGLRENEIDEFERILLIVKNDGKFGDLKNYFNHGNDSAFLKYLKKINIVMPLVILALRKYFNNGGYDINTFFKEFEDNDQVLINIIDFYQTHKKMIYIINKFKRKNNLDDSNPNSFLYMSNDYFISPEDLKKMDCMFDDLVDYLKKYQKVSRNNEKEILNLLNAKNALLDGIAEKKYIVNYYDIIKYVKDEQLKNMFLQVVRNHNIKYLNELEEKYTLLNKDSKTNVIALLAEYGITKGSYNIDIVMKNSEEDIEKLLKILKILDITNENKVIILETIDSDSINSIKEYLDRRILNKNLLENNLDIFTNNKKLDNLKKNLDIIKKSNLSLALFVNNISILLGESSLFNKNLNILLLYNLLKSIDTSDDLSYLLKDNLDKIIDRYLELGCEKYLENDLSLLNKNSFHKLEILKAMGIGISSKDELDKLLNEKDSFNIDNNEMDEVFGFESSLRKENLELDLEEYIETSRVYNFNGIRVSIIKVKRLLSLGYDLYSAIIDNMRLSIEDSEKLSEFFQNEIKKAK